MAANPRLVFGESRLKSNPAYRAWNGYEHLAEGTFYRSRALDHCLYCLPGVPFASGGAIDPDGSWQPARRVTAETAAPASNALLQNPFGVGGG